MLSAGKRLKKEYDSCLKNPDDSIMIQPSPENMLIWTGWIVGPVDSPFYGYKFDIQITAPPEYPLRPPEMKFLTKIFHPNIHFETGEVCMDILKKEWSPAWTLQSACRAILSVLNEPAPESPLNCDAGNMLRANDIRAYRSTVILYCEEFSTKI